MHTEGGRNTMSVQENTQPDRPLADPHVRVLLDRLHAGDLAWFRDRYRTGGLRWLEAVVGQRAYRELATHLKHGDLRAFGVAVAGVDWHDFSVRSNPRGIRSPHVGRRRRWLTSRS